LALEACGNSQWFVDLLQRLGHEVWIGDAAQIRARATKPALDAGFRLIRYVRLIRY
jgi:hypothetical protein